MKNQLNKKFYSLILLLVLSLTPIAINRSSSGIYSSIYISMDNAYNLWTNFSSVGSVNYSLSSDSYWSANSLKLTGTEVLYLDLTKYNTEYHLADNSMFKFAWKFESNSSDYIGFILYTIDLIYTQTKSYYIVSSFNPVNFSNSTTSAIYEFNKEQPNSWYEHTVNLTALFLQSYLTLPEKIVGVKILNANFGSTGLKSSNQISYFDDFEFYYNNQTTSLKTITNSPDTANTNIIYNSYFWLLLITSVISISGFFFNFKSRRNRKNYHALVKSNHNSKSLLCLKCGSKLIPSDKFCSNCGTPIVSSLNS